MSELTGISKYLAFLIFDMNLPVEILSLPDESFRLAHTQWAQLPTFDSFKFCKQKKKKKKEINVG